MHAEIGVSNKRRKLRKTIFYNRNTSFRTSEICLNDLLKYFSKITLRVFDTRELREIYIYGTVGGPSWRSRFMIQSHRTLYDDLLGFGIDSGGQHLQ